MTWDSSKIDLSLLRLRDTLQPYEEVEYPVKQRVRLAAPTEVLQIRGDLFRARRTCRQFGPISHEELGRFLWHAAHTCEFLDGTYGRVELRPSPSAGARHPIDLLIIEWQYDAVYVYDSVNHCLNEIKFDRADLHALLAMASPLLDYGRGALVWLIAQPARTLAKYEHGESFVLLDAGALIATLSFAAHALDLAFWPMSVSGEPWISRLLNSNERVIGILGGVVGTKGS